MTMVVRFGTHFAIRLGEWFASFNLVSIAILMFTATRMFESNPAYFVGLSTFADQPVWGTICGLFGIIRIAALWVNGRKPITPYIRMALSFFSCFVWWQLVVGLIASGVPGLGWVLVPWLLALEFYNVFRSAADAREVFDKKRAARNGPETSN